MIILCSNILHSAYCVDLCFLFGTCRRPVNTGRADSGFYEVPPANIIDGNWIEPVGSTSGFIYHFGHSKNAMDWYDADK